jgi:hypothetical protein
MASTKKYAKQKGISERTARWRAQKGKVSANKPGGRDWNITGTSGSGKSKRKKKGKR